MKSSGSSLVGTSAGRTSCQYAAYLHDRMLVEEPSADTNCHLVKKKKVQMYSVCAMCALLLT